MLDSFVIKVKVFADDFKLYVRIINEVDVTTLQDALNFFPRGLRLGLVAVVFVAR